MQMGNAKGKFSGNFHWNFVENVFPVTWEFILSFKVTFCHSNPIKWILTKEWTPCWMNFSALFQTLIIQIVKNGLTNNRKPCQNIYGGFQLLDLITTELKSHMTCYNSMPLITAFWLEGKSCKRFFFWQIKFPPMRDLEFLTGHVTFKLRYNQI